MIAAIFILQTSKIRGEREFTMNTNTVNSKKVISGINDLATECPKAAAMWSDKNAFTPSEVSAKNSKKRYSSALTASKSLRLLFTMSSIL